MSNTYYVMDSPEYYGGDCDLAEARECAERLVAALEPRYPNVTFRIGNGRDDFEDEMLRDEITHVVNENWTDWAFPRVASRSSTAIQLVEQIAFDALMTCHNVASIEAQLSGGGDSGELDWALFVSKDADAIGNVRFLDMSWLSKSIKDTATRTVNDWHSGNGGEATLVLRTVASDDGLPVWRWDADESHVTQYYGELADESMPSLLDETPTVLQVEALSNLSGFTGEFSMLGILSDGEYDPEFHTVRLPEDTPPAHAEALRCALRDLTISESWKDELSFEVGDATIKISGSLSVESGQVSLSDLDCKVATSVLVKGEAVTVQGALLEPFALLGDQRDQRLLTFDEASAEGSFPFLSDDAAALKEELVQFAQNLNHTDALFFRENEVVSIVQNQLNKALDQRLCM